MAESTRVTVPVVLCDTFGYVVQELDEVVPAPRVLIRGDKVYVARLCRVDRDGKLTYYEETYRVIDETSAPSTGQFRCPA